ncbi:HTH domain-containing protein [Lysinibacillus sp. FSL H8-0500]|uniref:HTH domain-containing protein n=1 Tax=Lysinibacillus sp. FSL H8-0500 TaxID=2921393 RepID=UPI003101293A
MSTKIAIICSKAFMQRIISIAQNITDIQLEFYLYNHPAEAPALLKQIKPCDALLLGGTLPYLYAQSLLSELPIPWNYLKQDETAISTTLLSLVAKHSLPIHRISIDVMNPKFVENVLTEIEYEGEGPYVQHISITEPIETILCQHLALWHAKSIDFIITSIHSVFDELQKQQIPAMRMLDTTNTIIQSLEETKSKSLLTKSESVKAVVGLLEIPEDTSVQSTIINHIAKSTFSTYKQTASHSFELYTTAGHLQKALEKGNLEKLIQKINQPFKLAFGYGHSILEATQHAQHALAFTKSYEIYVLDEHKNLLGPFPNSEGKLSLKTDDPYVLQMAKLTSLSPLNISKIINFSRERQSAQFTAQNLAEYLQVTRRTTERIIKKLVDTGYAKAVGEEMTHQQGRPRTIYELNFATY